MVYTLHNTWKYQKGSSMLQATNQEKGTKEKQQDEGETTSLQLQEG